MATPINLYREWKVPLSQSKYSPVAMQVSLFDLMFFIKNGKTYVRYLREATNSSFKSMGLELQHNIIVFDSNMYQIPINPKGYREIPKAYETGDTGVFFDDWVKSGFDICLPKFDKRTKPLFLKESNLNKYLPNISLTDFNSILNQIKPKKLDTTDFFYDRTNTSTYANGFKIFDKESALKPQNSFDFYDNSVLVPFNRDPGAQNTWEDYPDPWNVALESDYITDNVSESDIILSNRDISFEDRFINPASGMMAYNGLLVNYSSPRIWKNLFKYYNASEDILNNITSDLVQSFLTVDSNLEILSINPVLKYLLEHCYLWIKCSFFADYIDYRDFDQSLNKTSKVIHNNLMLTKTGDFKRYEELFSSERISAKDLARATRPYFPSTTPSVDILKDTLLPEHTIGNKVSEIQYIIDNASDPDSKIGSLPIEPLEQQIEDTDNQYTSQKLNAPPQIWFDPESRKSNTDYEDIPILFPKDGNLITDGRIISPTIDELWKIIKELIAGRRADSSQIENEPGLPRGTIYHEQNSSGETITKNKQTNFDSRPILKKHGFTQNEELMIGDPTIIDYEMDNEEPKYQVREWVNDPNKIEYQIIKELIDLNTIICNGADPDLIIESILSLPEPEQYLPDIHPNSLRELEAQLKGLRWNLVYYMTFMHHNIAYNGLLGRSNTDDKQYNQSGGSLYQLHKEYNPDTFNKPNTVYDERINRSEEVEYGIGLKQIIETINNKEIVPSFATYMGADGNWHSTKQMLLIPIRNDEEF